jgi:DNA-binding NarL/FixJ family response regulator
MSTQQEFIQQHATDGTLTAQQAAELLELGVEGDTGVQPENGHAPNVTAEADGAQDESEFTSENAVILAKDGKHTISYDELAKAREKAAEAREESRVLKAAHEQALQELSVLREQAQQRADAGHAPTVADNQSAAAVAAIEAGVDPEIFGDFSEEAIAKGVQTLIQRSVPALVNEQIQRALQPLQQKQQADARTLHFQAIQEKHPDLDSVVESRELANWLAAQPSFARASYEAVLNRGSAGEVIELLDLFKSANPLAATNPRVAAKAALANTQQPPPASLSDIPGGATGHATREEAMANMGAQELSEAMQSMSPDQIEAFLNRRL